jgi:hypothetical protein
MAKDFKFDDRTVTLLTRIVDDYWKEDTAARERQIRRYKHLKMLWDGNSQIYWDEVAHDWRIVDDVSPSQDGQQDYYDKPVNVFRAYLETIIAALSVIVPPVKCFPDDADNYLDLMTAKAGDKIGQLIYKHNNAQLLWLQALFIYCTEGMVACYSYPKESLEYGTYDEKTYEQVETTQDETICSLCGENIASEAMNETARDEFMPDDSDVLLHSSQDAGMEFCPNCMAMVAPEVKKNNLIVDRLVGITKAPKTRICQEVYGGLYVKVPNYARRQADIPYLIYSYETDFTNARARFPWIREKIQPNSGATNEPYERWGRQNPTYAGEWPQNNVTIRNCWLRPTAYERCDAEADVEYLKKKFPDGVRVVLVNDCMAEYENEALDDCWTLTQNPLSDFLTFDPLGTGLVPIQEITNDLVSLTQQTIEHGIPQTFADQNVLDFKAYGQQETTPGSIFPVKPRSGKNIAESFYQVSTASLSAEVMPFQEYIQSVGQLVVGAQPSLFGGDLAGSKTASEYSMSRAQALQRLQNTWKMFTTFQKEVMGKAIPMYIKEMRDDEQFTDVDDLNNFVNVFIRKAELQGKIGKIELEANENLPVTWSQQKDVILKLFEMNNPAIVQMIQSPENMPLIYEAIGLTDFCVPGLESRNKQYDEIKQLTNSEPLVEPPTEEDEMKAAMEGVEAQPIELPSVAPEEFDLHQIELEICIKWINSPAGQLCKQENPQGYKNVILHAQGHKMFLAMEMAQQNQGQMEMDAQGSAPLENVKENTETPISGEGDVTVN